MSDYAGDITAQEAWDQLSTNSDAVLVDVRTEAEWRFVGTPRTPDGAKPPVFVEWVTYPDGQQNPRFLEQLAEAGVTPDSDAPVFFLCRSGQRSIGAAIAATAAGFSQAYNILDGFEGGLDGVGHRGSQGWKASGLPWQQN